MGIHWCPWAAAAPRTTHAFEGVPTRHRLHHGRLGREGVDNVRIVPANGAQGLAVLFDDASLTELWTFFADPWRKARHHKRRLVSTEFADLVALKLRPGGLWRLATDWEDYAFWQRETLDAHPRLREPPRRLGGRGTRHARSRNTRPRAWRRAAGSTT